MPFRPKHTVHYGSGKEIAYLDEGPENGPLLIFLHGWPAIGKCWHPQLTALSGKGFRTVAPDMPGYGDSTARKIREDYSLESIVEGMLALLAHLGRKQAVWIGHDWGCGPLWAIASHHPEVCLGVAGMTVPYNTIELGLEELVRLVNRELYPVNEYPNGQWDYQAFYESSFEKATDWFNRDIGGFLKAVYKKGQPNRSGERAFTATVNQDGGWFGGIAKPPSEEQVPSEGSLLDDEIWPELKHQMQKTGFWCADAWYANHKHNREYTLKKRVNDGILTMPVLFIEATGDLVCDTANSPLAEPMRQMCKDLTEKSVESGHWVSLDKPEEVSQILLEWLQQRVAISTSTE